MDVADERTLKQYLYYLEKASIIRTLNAPSKRWSTMEKPDRIYLHNTCLTTALNPHNAGNIGTIRETFFCTALEGHHHLATHPKTDFLVDDTIAFEIGGKNKDTHQIKSLDNAYLAQDDIEVGTRNHVPLWVFGFLY